MNIPPRCTPLAPDNRVAARRNRAGYSSSPRLALGRDRRTSLTEIFTCNGYAHPVFGLGGVVLPYQEIRNFSTFFFQLKNRLLEFELNRSGVHPAKWEKKGSALYTVQNIGKYKQLRQATFRILNKIRDINGFVIYVGIEKRRTDGNHDAKKIYRSVLREAIKRIDQECDQRNSKFLLVLDEQEGNVMRGQIVETASIEMFGSSSRTRLIEPPMQVESHLYQTVQCADWLCGLFGRLAFFACDPQGKPDNEIAKRYFGARIRAVAIRSGVRREEGMGITPNP